MNILVVGGGGREHAIIKKLLENADVDKIYALPGNGGIASDAECAPVSATDIPGILDFAKSHPIDFAVVAPDDPLVMGLVDELEALGIPAFGPNKRAAIIEGSKVFSKNLMKKYGIPTAGCEIFEDSESALNYLENCAYPAVVKADGLALGKGVIICEDKASAREAVKSIMEDRVFGASGSRVVVEEFLEGPEVSVLTFTDGKTVVPMVSSMDHKRAMDNDMGLNTGGMGVIAPNPFYTEDIAERTMREILLPTINAMNAEGRAFKGCLYFGLMLTKDGPKVIEYNCRFGDPEAQAVLPLIKSDLYTIMRAVRDERLSEVKIEFSHEASCCVMVVSGGYPGHYEKGKVISKLPEGLIYHSGTKLENGELKTNGGRVLGAVATGKTLKDAIEGAYKIARGIGFEGAYMRGDIGRRAQEAIK